MASEPELSPNSSTSSTTLLGESISLRAEQPGSRDGDVTSPLERLKRPASWLQGLAVISLTAAARYYSYHWYLIAAVVPMLSNAVYSMILQDQDYQFPGTSWYEWLSRHSIPRLVSKFGLKGLPEWKAPSYAKSLSGWWDRLAHKTASAALVTVHNTTSAGGWPLKQVKLQPITPWLNRALILNKLSKEMKPTVLFEFMFRMWDSKLYARDRSTLLFTFLETYGIGIPDYDADVFRNEEFMKEFTNGFKLFSPDKLEEDLKTQAGEVLVPNERTAMCKWIQKTFNFDIQTLPEPLVRYAIMGIGCVGLICGFKAGASLTPLDDYLKNIGNYGRTLFYADRGYSTLKPILDSFLNLVSSTLGFSVMTEDDVAHREVISKLTNYNKKLQEYMNKVQTDPTYLLDIPNFKTELTDQLSQSNDLVAMVAGDKKSLFNARSILERIKMNHDTLQSIWKDIAITSGTKIEPACVCLTGTTAAGKSFLMNEIAEELSALHKQTLTRYTTNFKDDFESGYQGAHIYEMDDMGQYAHCKDHEALIAMATPATYLLNKADLQGKGTPFTSWYVAMSSNQLYFYDSTTIKDLPALNRRRGICVRVTNKYVNDHISAYGEPPTKAKIQQAIKDGAWVQTLEEYPSIPDSMKTGHFAATSKERYLHAKSDKNKDNMYTPITVRDIARRLYDDHICKRREYETRMRQATQCRVGNTITTMGGLLRKENPDLSPADSDEDLTAIANMSVMFDAKTEQVTLKTETARLSDLQNKLATYITGPPGCGKTHAMKTEWTTDKEHHVWVEATEFTIPDKTAKIGKLFINDVTKNKESWDAVNTFILDYCDNRYPLVGHVIMSGNNECVDWSVEQYVRFERRCDTFRLTFARNTMRKAMQAMTDAEWFRDGILNNCDPDSLVKIKHAGRTVKWSHIKAAMKLVTPPNLSIVYTGIVALPDGDFDYDVSISESLMEMFSDPLTDEAKIRNQILSPSNWRKGNPVSAGLTLGPMVKKIFQAFKGYQETVGTFSNNMSQIASALTIINNEHIKSTFHFSGALRLKDIWFGAVTNSQMDVVIGIIKTDIGEILSERTQDLSCVDPGTLTLHAMLGKWGKLTEEVAKTDVDVKSLTTTIGSCITKQRFGEFWAVLNGAANMLLTVWTMKDIYQAHNTLQYRYNATRKCEYYEEMLQEGDSEDECLIEGKANSDDSYISYNGQRIRKSKLRMWRQSGPAGSDDSYISYKGERVRKSKLRMWRQGLDHQGKEEKDTPDLTVQRIGGDVHDHVQTVKSPPFKRAVVLSSLKSHKPSIRHKNREVYHFAVGDYSYSGKQLKTYPLKGFYQEVCDTINKEYDMAFNSVLVNVYNTTSTGIGMHKDNEPDIDQSHPIFGLNFGESANLIVRDADGGSVKIGLHEGEMQIYFPEFQTKYSHGISKYLSDEGNYRVSLTLRCLLTLDAQAKHNPIEGTIEERVVKNQRSLVTEDKKHITFCLFGKDRMGWMPTHATHAKYIEVSEGVYFPFESKALTRHHGCDVSVFRVTDPKCVAFKDITRSVQTRRDLHTYQSKHATICVGQPGQPIKLAQVQISERTVRNVTPIGACHGFVAVGTLQGYQTGTSMTQAGDCGSAWILNDKTVQRPVIAIHSAGDSTSSFGTPIVFEELEEAWALSAQGADSITVLKHQRLVHHEGSEIAAVLNECKEDCVVGQLERPVRTQAKTKFYRSPLNVTTTKFVPFVPDEMEPPVFTNADPRIPDDFRAEDDVYWSQALKWLKPQEPIRVTEVYIQKFLRDFGTIIGNKMKNKGLTTKVCSVKEALNGMSDHVFSKPIHRHTSAGYPWQLDYRNGKMDALEFDERNGIWDLNAGKGQDLLAAVTSLTAACAARKKTATVFVCRQKDECRHIRKIYETPKTRTFASGALDLNLVWKRYFHSVEARIMELEDTPFTLGQDPLSLDWHKMTMYLLSKGEDFVDLDWPSFDSNFRNEVMRNMWIFYDTIAQITDVHWTEVHSRIREGVYLNLAEPLMVMGEEIVAQVNGGASGKNATTTDNSVFVVLNLVSAWDHIMGAAGYATGVEAFMEFVAVVTRGDDAGMAIGQQERDLFNYESIAKALKYLWDTEVTPGEKTAKSYKTKPLSEMDFVSREFVQVGQYWRGRLKLSSIDKMLNWNDPGPAHLPWVDLGVVKFDVQSIESTVESLELEMVLHGITKYRQMELHINECLRRIGSTKTMKGWDRARQLLTPPVPETYDG